MAEDLLMHVTPEERALFTPPPPRADYHLYDTRVISFDKDLNITYINPTLLASLVHHIRAYQDAVSAGTADDRGNS